MTDAMARHVARMMRDIAAQQKANRIKKRKLRALRAAVKDQRAEILMLRRYNALGRTIPGLKA